MAPGGETPTERALAAADLPNRASAQRVLVLGSGRPAGIDAEDVTELDRPEEGADLQDTGFDLVICDSELRAGVHPLALYAWVRKAIKPSGTLVAGSKILPDPAKSQYARFLPAAAAGGRDAWIPGRLAFRWMVEVSGFDVKTWLPDGDGSWPSDLAFLQAEAVDRTPPLDLRRQPLSR